MGIIPFQWIFLENITSKSKRFNGPPAGQMILPPENLLLAWRGFSLFFRPFWNLRTNHTQH